MQIYYMRDNHTFRPLSLNVNEAIEQVREEYVDGYTCGMLCSHDTVVPPIFARPGKFEVFMSEIRGWYAKVIDQNIGANI